MPAPSKFTEARKEQILAVLKVGGSRATACAIAGVNEETLRRWLKEGEEKDDPESAFTRFREDVLAAEAEPRYRALGIVHRSLPDKPELAWKVVERREPGYAPPQTGTSPAMPAVQINLSLTGSNAPLPAWIQSETEGVVIDAQEVPALGDGGDEPDAAEAEES